MLRWVAGIAVLLTVIALAARVLQLGISLALLGIAGVAALIAVMLGLMTWMQRGKRSGPH